MSDNKEVKDKEEPRRKVYAFDDGSLQSKVMFTEHSKDKSKELLSIQIKLPQPLEELDSLNLEDYINEIPEDVLKNEKLVKLDLHFTQEDFDKFGLDDQINKIRGKYSNLSIIKSYSFMSRRRVERLAKQIGILKEKKTKEEGAGVESEQEQEQEQPENVKVAVEGELIDNNNAKPKNKKNRSGE